MLYYTEKGKRKRGTFMNQKLIQPNPKQSLICVPIAAYKEEEIENQISMLSTENIDMIEWRIDCFEYWKDLEKIKAMLHRLKEKCDKSILLVTFRTIWEGGETACSKEEYFQLLNAIAGMHLTDYLDVEIMRDDIEEIQKICDKVKVITSFHDFEQTPSIEKMYEIAEKMNQVNSAVLKMASMPQDFEDVLRVMNFTYEYTQKYKEKPLITMSMGRLGAVSRISGGFTGSAVTFATSGQKSAPGQMPWEKVKKAMDLLGDEE